MKHTEKDLIERIVALVREGMAVQLRPGPVGGDMVVTLSERIDEHGTRRHVNHCINPLDHPPAQDVPELGMVILAKLERQLHPPERPTRLPIP